MDNAKWKILPVPVPDEFSCIKRRGRPLGVKLKNTAKVRFAEPVCNSDAREEKDVIDKFSSQPGSQGASANQGETCRKTSDTILFEKTSHNVDFPLLKKRKVSEVDHNFFPWRGSESKEKWTDIVKKSMK